jgi:hypothetical protein
MLSVPPLIPADECRGGVPEYAGRAVVRQRSNFLSQMISLNKKGNLSFISSVHKFFAGLCHIKSAWKFTCSMSCSVQRIKVVDSLFICYLERRLMVVSDWRIFLKQSIDHGNAVRPAYFSVHGILRNASFSTDYMIPSNIFY